MGVNGSVNWPIGRRQQGQRRRDRSGQTDPGRDRLHRADLRATRTRSAYGTVKNAAGKFVKASTESVTAAAAAAAKQMPADFRVSITNAPGEGAYPIASFTWLLLYQNPQDKSAGQDRWSTS